MTALSVRALRRLMSWARQRQGAAERVVLVDHEARPVADPEGAVAHASSGPVHEPHELVLEHERHLAQRAVAVLGDQQVGLAGPLAGLGVVVVVAVDEDHEVGVLLDLARLAQVAEQRPLVGPRLDAARELRQRDHRDLQLAGQDLQATAHLADLLDPALDAAVGAHQLQVVDDDQPEAALGGVLGVQPPRLGPDLEDPDVGRVVEVQRRVGVVLGGVEDELPLALLLQPALAQVVALDPRAAGDEPLGELGLGHLEAEQRHRRGDRCGAARRSRRCW